MKITVVILDFDPAANSERCISSVLCQTHRDMEILVMSRRKIGTQDERIVYLPDYLCDLSDIDTAIKHATGEYVCFVETGCCLSPVFVETMVKMCTESRADMASCGFMETDGHTPVEQIGVPLRLYHPTAMDRYAFMGMLENDRDNVYNFFENKLYRTAMLKDSLPVTGDDKLDKGIVWHIAHRCTTITITEEPLFFYTAM